MHDIDKAAKTVKEVKSSLRDNRMLLSKVAIPQKASAHDPLVMLSAKLAGSEIKVK